MSCWAIIPVKSPARAKSRLSDVLNSDQRQRLVETMLAHVLHVASNAPAISHVHLLASQAIGFASDFPVLPDPGADLNGAVAFALREVGVQGPDRVLFLAADLPELASDDIEHMVRSARDTVTIATDRHGVGTNAISLPLPAARDFQFAFGPDSLKAHSSEARRLGFEVDVVDSPGLSRDIDDPDDLAQACAVLDRIGR